MRVRSCTLGVSCAFVVLVAPAAATKKPLEPKRATADACRATALKKPTTMTVERTIRPRIFAFRMRAPAINPDCSNHGRRNIAVWMETTAQVTNEYGQLRRYPWEKVRDSGTAIALDNDAQSTRTTVKFLPSGLCAETPPPAPGANTIDARVVAVTLWRTPGYPDISSTWPGWRRSDKPEDVRRNARIITPENQLRHNGPSWRVCERPSK